ncbi:MAG: NAD(P)/FAD-dependent oxidoreductase [Deltaproteobacteria bacterium]|nr:NAD(P)/FAD-dependent oxidoreductase [Deltaproteobacteria bacterium]
MNYPLFKTEGPCLAPDALIIGSGIGGLACAGFLAKNGKKVLILEKHKVAGGFTHTFQRKGYEWDVGLHYVGEVQQQKNLLRKAFDYLSDGQLDWADMGEVYDKVFIGEKSFDFVKGVQNFKNKLIEYFPNEKIAIEGYVEKVFELTRSSKNFFMAKALPSLIAPLASSWLKKNFLKLSRQSTLQVLNRLTQNQELRAVLSAQYGDYGLAPAQSSFAIHALVAKHYFEGGSYPVGGSGRIAATIYSMLKKHGGEIFVRAEVKEILIRNQKAYGVKLAGGEIIEAPLVISDVGVLNTYNKLIPQPSEKLKNAVKEVEPSLAHLCLYIGLKQPQEILQLPKSNYWIYPSADHDQSIASYLKDPENSAPPVCYISFPSAKDPSWEKRFPGKSTIEVIGVCPYEWFKKWEDKPRRERGDDYKAFKEKLAKPLLELLYQHVPQVKDQIDYYEISTPLSTRYYCNYAQGEIYGLAHTPQRFDQDWLKPQTPIKNLFLTGQDITTDGIAGALMAGLLTASVILRKNLIKELYR